VYILRYPLGDEGKPLLHVFATPERAMGQAQRKLRLRGDDAQGLVPLPIVSVDRLADAYDSARANVLTLPRLAMTPGNAKFLGTQWPIPMTLTYQLNLWCKQLRDISALTVQLLHLFPPSQVKYLTVEHPAPFGRRIVPALITDVSDSPKVGEAEKERLLRRVFTIRVDGWVARPANEYGYVEQVTVDFYESDDMVTEGEHLGQTVVTEGA